MTVVTERLKRDAFAPYLGMSIALAAWTMLFAALFFVYAVLRVQAGNWYVPATSEMSFKQAVVNTFIILLSSWTYFQGTTAIKAGNVENLKRSVAVTFGLGLLFLLLQLSLWATLTDEGLGMQTSMSVALLFIFTGFHGFHIVGGIVALLWMMIQIFQGKITDQNFVAVNLVGYFWHFLTVVWLLMFVTIFIIR